MAPPASATSSASAPKSSYISTDTGNKVSRKSAIYGSQNIILGGKTIIQPSVVLRGDLRRAGAVGAGTGGQVTISVGKYSVLGEGCTVRPPCKAYKGVFSYYPLKIGDFVSIGSGSIISCATIGNGVDIGKNCIIGPFSILKDNCKINDNSVVGAGSIVPSLVEWGGSPAGFIHTLPESTPESVEARAKNFYNTFNSE